ncbi:hypothetical protein BKA83DRAFT_9235 [Pisolithus microcarpus]|nr:hypothetical protein BKA83DRAFT_9235 [Pisolithus microcarpus]
MPDVHSHSIGAAFGSLAFHTLNAPRLAEPTFLVQINELDLYHPPSISWGHEDWFYVDVDIDGRVQTTSVVGKHELPWKEAFNFDARLSSVITLRVFAERKLHKDSYVGSIQGSLETFLGSSGKAVLHDLSPPHSHDDHHASRKTKISFSVKRVGEAVEPSFPSTKLPISEHRQSKEYSRKDEGAEPHVPATKQPEAILCDKALQARRSIHPYVKMAAVVLTSVFTSHIALKNNIKNLVETMADAHSFLSESDPLARINSHLQIIRALSAQTVECSYFLQGIVKRRWCIMSQQLWMTNIQRKFDEYTQKFQQLRACSAGTFNVLRVYDEVQGISAQISLDNMHYAEDVHYTNVDECDSLEPDQRQLSDDISRWINGDSTERYLLSLRASCMRKNYLARLFDGLQRLGSSYFVRQPHEDHNPHFKQAVGEKVKKRAIQSSNHIRTQFLELILEPAKQISWCGPVLIVIDSLDICKEHRARKDLLNMLATKAAELPPNFRILVTSQDVHPPLPGDSISESDLEERGDLMEYDEQDIYPYDGDTSPPPPYTHEDAIPRDRSPTPSFGAREQTDVAFHQTGSPLRRGHALHLHDAKNGLKSVRTKAYMAVHGHHVDGDVQDRDHPDELSEAEYLEKGTDGCTWKSSARAATLCRVKSDRVAVADNPNRQYCRPVRPPHRSRLIVAHEAIHL